jgi:glyoxylase-like metal-dependent hydrolase (beta-lactamase superfamily II)
MRQGLRRADGEHFDRRGLLKGLAAAASLAPLASLGLGGAALAQEPTVHRFKVGTFGVTVVSDGTLTLPLSFVLPATDEAERRAILAPALRADTLVAQVNVAIVEAGPARVLIDTGGGPDFVPTLGKLADRLGAAGIAPESITHVVFTHGHPDHLWGVIDPLGDASMFGKARHIMTGLERDFWLKPGVEKLVPAAMEGMAAGTQRRMKQIEERIEAGRPGSEVVKGLTLVATPGHTPGHASVLVRSGSESLMIGGDALSQSIVSFEKPDWRWGPDLDPDLAIQSRKKLLDHLATDKIALLGYHLPWPGVGRVERKGTAYRFVSG